MDFIQYFDEEMRYLATAGKDFSSKFPEQAGYLNLTSSEDRDPYVERLMESFAFLTARIRQKLDDDLPEVTEPLLELAAPGFLSPQPSQAILQFGCRPGMLQSAYSIPKGTEVLSNPVGSAYTTCHFKTLNEVNILPLNITDFKQTHDSAQGHGMEFIFTCEAGIEVSSLQLDTLPVYIEGDSALAWGIYELLTKHITYSFIIANGSKVPSNPDGFKIKACAFPPHQDNASHLQPLRDFFSFRDKFRYIEFTGLKALRQAKSGNCFSLVVYVDVPSALPQGLAKDNFRLYTTPITNVFEHTAEPVDLNHHQFEYKITPKQGDSYHIVDVKGALGIDKNTGDKSLYVNFSDFRHNTGSKSGQKYSGCYKIRREWLSDSDQSIHISIASPADTPPRPQYLSLDLICSNGSLPREHIAIGDICNPPSGFPDFIWFKNITRPTPPLNPPRHDKYIWKILSILNMNINSIVSEGVLKEALTLIDWEQSQGSRHIINSIKAVSSTNKTSLKGGRLYNGAQVFITMTDSAFTSHGEADVFGNIINQWLSGYVTINYMVSLKLKFTPSDKYLEWEPITGLCQAV